MKKKIFTFLALVTILISGCGMGDVNASDNTVTVLYSARVDGVDVVKFADIHGNIFEMVVDSHGVAITKVQ